MEEHKVKKRLKFDLELLLLNEIKWQKKERILV